MISKLKTGDIALLQKLACLGYFLWKDMEVFIGLIIGNDNGLLTVKDG